VGEPRPQALRFSLKKIKKLKKKLKFYSKFGYFSNFDFSKGWLYPCGWYKIHLKSLEKQDKSTHSEVAISFF